jgi:hypothetical protein
LANPLEVWDLDASSRTPKGVLEVTL